MIDKELRILMLEDSADDVELIKCQLRSVGLVFSLVAVETKDGFLKELDSFSPDIIMADYTLPSYDGLSALRITKELRPELPFIFVSGTIGEDFASACLKSGADDYVLKNSLSRLIPAMDGALRRIEQRPDKGLYEKSHEGLKPDVTVTKGDGKMGNPLVLIIDDDTGLRKTLSDILRVKGYKTLSAKDGAEGIDLLRKNSVKVALIDLRLPDMSGIDVLAMIREERPLTQAIILTGNATLESAIDATYRGAFSYLQKPYDIDQLLLHMKRAIEKQQSDEKINSQSLELQRNNSELKALYDISKSISKTIELEKMLPEILQTITGIEIFSIEQRGAIFLVEEDSVRLFSHAGLSDEAAVTCNNVRPGDCLCGLAASTGEILISKNSVADARHTRTHSGSGPHGHIIVPLKSANQVVGVLCLYTPPDIEINTKVFHMLFAVGNQLGVAIANSKLYEEAKSFSLHDPLTGLANRRLMDVILQKSCARAIRFGTSLSVVMIDIDHFKNYNDTYGHVAGDKMLSSVARIIAARTREGDLAVRFGGEEFLMLIHQADLEKTRAAAEAVRTEVEAERGITISLGVASFSDGLSAEELIAVADKALYRAKQSGRNRVEVWP